MPKAMSPYLYELNQQARNALDCHAWMLDALARLDALPRLEIVRKAPPGHTVESVGSDVVMRHFWLYAQAFLTASAAVSLIFWPSPRGRKELAEAREYRANVLRARYGMADTSPLAQRELRDDFTHYDERLDAWVSDVSRTVFVDGNIGPVAALPFPQNSVLRHYDPGTDRFVFLGTEYALGPIVDELRRISVIPIDERWIG